MQVIFQSIKSNLAPGSVFSTIVTIILDNFKSVTMAFISRAFSSTPLCHPIPGLVKILNYYSLEILNASIFSLPYPFLYVPSLFSVQIMPERFSQFSILALQNYDKLLKHNVQSDVSSSLPTHCSPYRYHISKIIFIRTFHALFLFPVLTISLSCLITKFLQRIIC